MSEIYGQCPECGAMGDETTLNIDGQQEFNCPNCGRGYFFLPKEEMK